MRTGLKRSLLLLSAFLGLGCVLPAQSLTTTFNSNNGGGSGWMNMFDLKVTNPKGIRITALDLNLSSGATKFHIEIYLTPQTYVGKDGNAKAWIKVSQGTGIRKARNTPSHAEVDDFFLAPGSYGISILFKDVSMGYTNGNGTNQTYKNSDLTLQAGLSKAGFFSGSTFKPRVWNGTIYYAGPTWASYGPYGEGCKGTAGVPTLAAAQGSLPKVGKVFTLEMANLPTKPGPVFVLTGYNKDKLGPIKLPFDLTPLGMTGCKLLLGPVTILVGANTGGKGQLKLSIPNSPYLLGAAFYNQALVLDQKANAAGFVMSNGGEGQIGQ